MSDIVISNTSLAAIVRDEKMNPAGGIVDFVDCVMPFVEEGVIFDTGSLDGTRELLEELEFKYLNLKIFDTEFRGYSDARNKSLKKVDTKYAFVLDADERLSKEDFSELRDYMGEQDLGGYNFKIKSIYPDRDICLGGHNPRLFNTKKGFKFKKELWEFLYLPNGKRVDSFLPPESNISILIKHFVSDSFALKSEKWYGQLKDCSRNMGNIPAPSQTKGFEKWKAKNPLRDNYQFGI